MQRTLAQLQKECKRYGIEPPQRTGRGGKYAKRDYVAGLGDYFIRVNFAGKAPWGLAKRRSWNSPMLSFLFSNLDDGEQRDVLSGPDWVFEEKVDGVRMLLMWDGEGNFEAYSRNISVEDYLPVAYHHKIPIQDFPAALKGKAMILDCEVQCIDPNVNTILKSKGVITETLLQATSAILALNTDDSRNIQESHPLRFFVFDVMHYDGKDVMHYAWKDRRKFIEKLVPHFTAKLSDGSPQITHLPVVHENRKEFLDGLIAEGKEGVIAKNIHSSYIHEESRKRTHWIKVKRTMSQSLNAIGYGDSIDGYVVGFERGKAGSGFEDLIGSLDIAVNLVDSQGNETEHVIARCANIELELRKQITQFDDNGEMQIDPNWLGKVLEIDGQDVSARAKRFTHARIIRIRDDKSQFECVMMKEDLEKFIL